MLLLQARAGRWARDVFRGYLTCPNHLPRHDIRGTPRWEGAGSGGWWKGISRVRIGVAILPGQRFNASVSVCVVIDVLRASSSIVTLLERGCEAVVVATDIEEARRLHGVLPDYLLCGEAEGLPPEGFDYGNSPVEFSRLELAGKSAVLATSNATRVLAALAAESL